MATTPPERVDLDHVIVRRETSEDAGAIADAIGSNLNRLRPWMEWAVTEAATIQSQRTRIAESSAQWDAGTVYDYVITNTFGVEVLGKAGLRRTGDDVLEIGYWLTDAAQGRGVMTAVVSALTDVALGIDGITRAEIHCDAANSRSSGIPKRLGFRLDRTIDHPVTTSSQTGRQMIWIYDASP